MRDNNDGTQTLLLPQPLWQTWAQTRSQSPSPHRFPKKPNPPNWWQTINGMIYAALARWSPSIPQTLSFVSIIPTEVTNTHTALLRKAGSGSSSLYIPLAQAVGRQGCQPVIPATTDNWKRVPRSKVIPDKLDTRKANPSEASFLGTRSSLLGNTNRESMPEKDCPVKIRLDPIWYITKLSFYFSTGLLYMLVPKEKKKRTSPAK